MNDKQYTEGISIEKSKFGKWFDNFWYHYKWTAIVVAFFLVVGLVCSVQMCTKEKNDIIVVYAARNQLSVAEAEDVSRVLEAVCPEDFDGNGKMSVDLSYYCIMSEEDIKNAQAQTDADGNHAYIDNSYNVSQYDTYYGYLQTGESSVLMISPYLYEKLLNNDRLATIEDALGYNPEHAMSEYAVRLCDTAIYQNYGVMKKLPDDTVVCILRPYIAGKSSKEKYYAREKQMFESIIKAGEVSSEN